MATTTATAKAARAANAKPGTPNGTRKDSARTTTEARPATKAGRNGSAPAGEGPLGPHAQTAVVRAYLEAALGPPPRRVDTDALEARIGELAERARDASVLDRLALTQRRLELEAELAAAKDAPDPAVELAQREDAFRDVAAVFSERKGITWDAWRELGVPARVLRSAGLTP